MGRIIKKIHIEFNTRSQYGTVKMTDINQETIKFSFTNTGLERRMYSFYHLWGFMTNWNGEKLSPLVHLTLEYSGTDVVSWNSFEQMSETLKEENLIKGGFDLRSQFISYIQKEWLE